jgi:predicted heme/steroid binding protein
VYPAERNLLKLIYNTREAPKDTPFKLSELKTFDGSDPSQPIYVAIKGTVFDVSKKPEMYGAGSGYNCFAGKDASKVTFSMTYSVRIPWGYWCSDSCTSTGPWQIFA